MKLLVAAALILASGAAGAAERAYAVMSLIGDGVMLVQHRPTAGSSLSDRTRQFVPFDERIFDRGALRAMQAGIHHADPTAKVILLAGRDAQALAAEKDGLGQPTLAQSVADALRGRLPQVGATHLVLLLKARDAAPLPRTGGNVDAGELEGIGFYVDPTLVTRLDEASPAALGYFAPYAYFTLALVDLATGKVVAQKRVHAANPYEAARSNALRPWDSLGPDEKVRALQALLDDQAESAATALVGSR
jgi:hypothetical protein